MNIRALLAYVNEARKDQGFWLLYNAIAHPLHFLFYKKLRRAEKHHTFFFNRRRYHYFYSFYHGTYLNERAVEIPIVMELIRKVLDKRILEIGNVLPHYFNFKHTVIDKYEIYPGVINQDVVDFKSDIKYDLIVSISTLEHVGWDEHPKDDTKILRAIEKLKTLLNADGKIIITLPLGQNPVLDMMIKNKSLSFDEQRYLLRVSRSNEWKEATWEEVRYARYNSPYLNANAIIVATLYATSEQ